MFEQKISGVRYQYDAMDRLTRSAPANGAEAERFYCAGKLVSELKGAECYSVFQHGSQLLALKRSDNGTLQTRVLITDFQRSVLNALNSQPTAYSPYGYCRFGESSFPLVSYAGQTPEPVTGHYLLGNGHRAYNPTLSRFNSPDALSPFGRGGINAYSYCQGDPINRSDPNGRYFSKLMNALNGAVGSVENFFSRKIAGMHSKRISNLSSFSSGVASFEDAYHGEPRLNFTGHGRTTGKFELNEGGHDLGGTHKPGSAYHSVDADEFHRIALQRGISFEKYSSVRILACTLGDAVNGQSFASRLSELIDLPVKAYQGTVNVRLNIGGRNHDVGSALPVIEGREAFLAVGKGNGWISAEPVNYRPVISGHQMLSVNVRR